MSLLEARDQQQELYTAEREKRFDVLLTVVEWLATSSGTPGSVVVGLGAGPATIGKRLHP